MSNFKRAPVAAAPASRSSLAVAMKSVSIISSKPKLPAEIIELILGYLSPPDLIRVALAARRMKEMVYEENRWVMMLKSMGCWNDAEARDRAEDLVRRQHAARSGSVAIANGTVNRAGAPTGRKQSATLFDAKWEQEKTVGIPGSSATRPRQDLAEGGFETVTFVSNGHTRGSSVSQAGGPTDTLKVLSKVSSIRGQARQEFGKVYGALAPFYLDLAVARSHTDPKLFRVFRDPEQQAQMLSQLRTFAESDCSSGWQARQEKLESMIGVFENAVLREFEQGIASQDIDGGMRRYAHVLVTLNGGVAAIDTFIQSHPLMTAKEKLGDPLDCLPGGAHGMLLIYPAQDFFRKLAASLNEQSAIIDRVFPPTVDVLMPLIERLADDVVSEYVTTLFDEAHEGNTESYLKAVSGVFESSLRCAISIEPGKASKPSFSTDVLAVFCKCFEQHVDLYMQEELEYFKSACEAEVSAWEKRLATEAASNESYFMSNVSRQAAKADFLSSFKKVVMVPVNVMAMPFSNAKATPITVSGASLEPPKRTSTPLSLDRSSTPVQVAPTDELAAKAAIMNSRLEGIRSLFSIEVALNLVHTAKASLERMALFVRLGGQSGEEAREQCEAIFVSLLQLLGPRHIQSGFDQAVQHLSQYNPREIGDHGQAGVEPLVTFLELVNVGDLIQQMIDVFYAQELVAAKLSDGDDFLSPAVKEKKRFEQILDERVAAGLNKGIDVLMDEVEYICATTQLPTDYNPVGIVTDVGPSETAKRIVQIVSKHTGMLTGSTDKNMLDVFNQEVGLRLFTALCKHLKRQRVSVDGAIKLISDTNHYKSYIRSLRNKSLNQYFDALSEMTQIYLIDPAHAREIGKIIADPDRYHGIFRAEEVYEYAERRADWFGVKKDVERAMYGMGCGIM